MNCFEKFHQGRGLLTVGAYGGTKSAFSWVIGIPCLILPTSTVLH
jgi:hypothetical protein